jgi:hypothetical protein
VAQEISAIPVLPLLANEDRVEEIRTGPSRASRRKGPEIGNGQALLWWLTAKEVADRGIGCLGEFL